MLPRKPLLNLVCLAWTAVWMGVLAPGHERGVVQLPGGPACAVSATEAPADRPHACCSRPADTEDAPPADPASNCAVCRLLATLDAPPTIDLSVPPPTLLPWLTPLAPIAEAPPRPFLSTGNRDPPRRLPA